MDSNVGKRMPIDVKSTIGGRAGITIMDQFLEIVAGLVTNVKIVRVSQSQ